VRVVVDADSELAGTTLGDERVKTQTGMRIIAVRRATESERTGREGGAWVVSPGPTTALDGGDVLIAKGTRSGAERLGGLAGDTVDVDDE